MTDRPRLANRDLAEVARQLAERAPNGSLERRAWACAAVALSTTGTVASARRVLAIVEGPAVRAAAIAAVDQVAKEDRCGPT